jgi:hypothetical protein
MRNLIIISEACQYLYKKCGNCCILTLAILGMQDSKNFGWEINGDINFNWKTLLENKVGATTTKKKLKASSLCMLSTSTGSPALLRCYRVLLPEILKFSCCAD